MLIISKRFHLYFPVYDDMIAPIRIKENHFNNCFLNLHSNKPCN